MWFDTWADIGRVLIVGAAAYAVLIVLLRIFGKRTLSQLNAFDFIVTVALGSTLATILLSSDVSWAEGAAALALLGVLQFVVALTSSRWTALRRTITAEPTVLLRDGELDEAALRRTRLNPSEVRQAVRSSGIGDLGKVAIVVLEANGKLSVISSDKAGDLSALADVER